MAVGSGVAGGWEVAVGGWWNGNGNGRRWRRRPIRPRLVRRLPDVVAAPAVHRPLRRQRAGVILARTDECERLGLIHRLAVGVVAPAIDRAPAPAAPPARPERCVSRCSPCAPPRRATAAPSCAPCPRRALVAVQRTCGVLHRTTRRPPATSVFTIARERGRGAMQQDRCRSARADDGALRVRRSAYRSAGRRLSCAARERVRTADGVWAVRGPARHRASASTSTRRPFPPTVQHFRQRHCPCWNRQPVPQILAAAQPLPLINDDAAQPPPFMNADGAQRSGDRSAAACHAVYRELGGVPTPPNLRPFSRAGARAAKGLPPGRGTRAPLQPGPAWQAHAGSVGWWSAVRDGQRAGATVAGVRSLVLGRDQADPVPLCGGMRAPTPPLRRDAPAYRGRTPRPALHIAMELRRCCHVRPTAQGAYPAFR